MGLLVDSKNPTTFDDVIIEDNIRNIFKTMVADPWHKLRNMTLAGQPGIGKTTIAKLLIKLIGSESYWSNASKHNGADDMRYTLTDFTGAVPMNDVPKIVVLDEADCLSIGKAGSAGAQEILRGIIEEAQDDTRFILTCNYPQRIIPALLSRCPIINIQFTPKMIMERVIKILKEEKVKASKSDLELFYNTVVKQNFPKIRNIIHTLDLCIDENKKFVLDRLPVSSELSTDFDEFVDEFIDVFTNSKKPVDIRKYYINNGDKFEEDYVKLGNAMFKKLMDDPVKQITIADYIYKMGTVIDPEVQFYAMLLELKSN